jgi:hypothetical protein
MFMKCQNILGGSVVSMLSFISKFRTLELWEHNPVNIQHKIFRQLLDLRFLLGLKRLPLFLVQLNVFIRETNGIMLIYSSSSVLLPFKY